MDKSAVNWVPEHNKMKFRRIFAQSRQNSDLGMLLLPVREKECNYQKLQCSTTGCEILAAEDRIRLIFFRCWNVKGF